MRPVYDRQLSRRIGGRRSGLDGIVLERIRACWRLLRIARRWSERIVRGVRSAAVGRAKRVIGIRRWSVSRRGFIEGVRLVWRCPCWDATLCGWCTQWNRAHENRSIVYRLAPDSARRRYLLTRASAARPADGKGLRGRSDNVSRGVDTGSPSQGAKKATAGAWFRSGILSARDSSGVRSRRCAERHIRCSCGRRAAKRIGGPCIRRIARLGGRSDWIAKRIRSRITRVIRRCGCWAKRCETRFRRFIHRRSGSSKWAG